MHTTHATTRRLLLALLTTLALALTACAGDGNGDGAGTDAAGTDTTAGEDADDGAAGDDDPTATDATEADTADGDADDDGAMADATVAVATSDLGDILVDGEGRTLYMFVPDDQGDPTCTDDCAATWPPFEGPATAGEGADGALLATATHPSGTTQATYDGWPLYYFANDQAPGDTNGQGLNDVWFVLGPDGEPIRDANAASGQDRGY